MAGFEDLMIDPDSKDKQIAPPTLERVTITITADGGSTTYEIPTMRHEQWSVETSLAAAIVMLHSRVQALEELLGL
jgi:hypothetical protein